MAELKLFVFGQPRLEVDRQPIDLNLRRALALLAYLAVSAKPYSRDALATMLWPESDGREGRARLRRTLHRLQQAIGSDILDSGSETIRLAPGAALWLDSAAFRQQVTAGLAAPKDADERLARLNAAVELYTEDFLAGFTLPDSPAFDEWQFFQRESLRQLYGQALEQLVQGHRARQDWDQAVASGRRWVALDALHEPAHRLLMQLYAEAGRHAAALRQYAECARLLEAELGAEPEDETTALYEAIRLRQVGRAAPAAEPEPAPLAAEPPAPLALEKPRQRPSFIGDGSVFVARDPELRWLDQRLAAAFEGQRGIAFVAGEAGQGKTALLRTFADAAQAAYPNLIVAWGSCNAYTGIGDPFLPFRDILELLTGDVDARALAGSLQQAHAERLQSLLPAAAQALLDAGPDLLDTFIASRRLLSRVASYSTDAAPWLLELRALVERKVSAPAQRQQQALFDQYAQVLQALARQAPLLLILDDLQWADPGSTDLLLHLGRRLQGHRVLIVGAYRPADIALGRDGQRHPLEPTLNELQREFGEIVLDLSLAEGRAFVDALLDCQPNGIDDSFRDALYQQTGGHPLFTIELLRDMRARGDLVCDQSGCWLASPQLHWLHMPARVEGAIGERIGRLGPHLREILQVASVEGEEFTAEVIARVLGAEEHEIVRQLSRELDQTHRLVQALGVRRDEGVRLSRYRFQHIVIQRYLYGSLDEVERVYQHEAVGHALESIYKTRAAEIAAQLARHFQAAQLPEKAATYHAQTGDRALRMAAFAAAIAEYQAALGAWRQSDPRGQALLLRRLGECQWMLGHLQDAQASFEGCYSLYDSLGEWEGAGGAQRLIGRLYWEQGDRERSLQHAYQALALLESGPQSIELAWAISSISQMHMLASANDEAISWGQRALAMAERLGAKEVEVHALANIGSAYFGSGDAERGSAMLRRSWQLAVELNLPNDACRAANNLGVSLVYYGLPAEALVVFEDLRTYAMRRHIHLNAGLALVSLAKLDWLTGHWQSALTRREELVAWIGQGQSNGYLKVLADTMFAWMYNDLGQPAAARQMLEQAQPLVAGRAEIHTTGPQLGQQVRTFGLLDRRQEATAAARQFLELSEQQIYWDPYMSHLAVCRWFAGNASQMHAELGASLAQIERADAHFGSPATAAALSEARGRVALSEADTLRAEDYLQQAAAQWQALGYPYHQACALADLGRALVQGDAADAAGAAFEQALDLLEALAAQLEDAQLQAAFLDSPLMKELLSARSAMLAEP